MALQQLDGPSLQSVLTLDTVTPQRYKGGASEFDERKVITIQPTNGSVYVYFANDGEAPSATDVATKGFIHTKNLKDSYEAADSQRVWGLAVSGTVNVRLAERG